jgi:type IV secretory pathway VirB4 component
LIKEKFKKAILNRQAIFAPRFQILAVSELATLWHLPGINIKIPNIAWGRAVLTEAPENLPASINLTDEQKQAINFFARTEFKNKLVTFGIKQKDRRRHIYVIGKTGTGKTTLIANMAIDDLKKKKGLAVIDPHGDLSEILLNYIPSHRINDVVYLDPADKEHPFSINVLEVKDPAQAELAASGIVSIFYKLYSYSWGPRLEHILRNTLLTLAQIPNSTLVDVIQILTNKNFRRKALEKLDDPTSKRFWLEEFEKMPDRFQQEAISPILNKVGQFVSSPLIRGLIGRPKSTIDLEEIMNQGKILIINLSQGRLGEDNSALLGAMIITKIQLAAMSRVNIPEEKRRDFYLYVDEFQNFATDSFIKILSEARKYRLNLCLANQYMAQLDEGVQKAILGNAGSLISFLVGAEDAQILEKEFGGIYTANDLVGLSNFQTIIKLAIDNLTSRPFFAYTLPLPKSTNLNRPKVIRVSRERYSYKK